MLTAAVLDIMLLPYQSKSDQCRELRVRFVNSQGFLIICLLTEFDEVLESLACFDVMCEFPWLQLLQRPMVNGKVNLGMSCMERK